MTTYKGYRVLDDDPNVRNGITMGLVRNVERLTNPAGNAGTQDRDTEKMRVQLLWFLEGKDAIYDFITTYVPERMGRKNALWVPTFTRDFVIDESTGHYYDDGIVEMWNKGAHRKYFYAQWMSPSGARGSWANMWYAMTPVAGNRVDLSMIFSPVDVAGGLATGTLKFSRMFLMRQETDEVSLSWYGPDVAEATLNFIEVPRVEYPISAPYDPV